MISNADDVHNFHQHNKILEAFRVMTKFIKNASGLKVWKRIIYFNLHC